MEENNREKSSDAQNIADILDAVGDRIPTLIRNVTGSMYTRETGTSMGQAVGAYYKELVDAGIPQEAALEMTKDYSFSLRKVMPQGGGDGHAHAREGFSFNYTPRDKGGDAKEDA